MVDQSIQNFITLYEIYVYHSDDGDNKVFSDVSVTLAYLMMFNGVLMQNN